MSESPKKLSDRPMPNMAGLPDEPMPKCSLCRRPAGTNPACDRCASYRRMVRERDNPTEAERAAKREWETAFRMEQEALNAAAQARVSRLSGFTVSVGLVGCGKTKLKHVALAKDLYTSPLFRAARRYAERCCHEWVILSAGHHVLLPEQAVAPYERSLSKLRLREKEHWALIVTDYLKQHYARLDVRYIGLAGEDYLSLLGIPVERPLEGLGIGERIKRLHTMVSECSASERKVAARILDLMIERKRARLPDAQRSAAEILWQRRRGLYLFLAESTVLAQRKGTAKVPSAEWAVEQLASELRTRSKAPQLTAWLTQRAPQLTGFCRAIWDDAFTDWLASGGTRSHTGESAHPSLRSLGHWRLEQHGTIEGWGGTTFQVTHVELTRLDGSKRTGWVREGLKGGSFLITSNERLQLNRGASIPKSLQQVLYLAANDEDWDDIAALVQRTESENAAAAGATARPVMRNARWTMKSAPRLVAEHEQKEADDKARWSRSGGGNP